MAGFFSKLKEKFHNTMVAPGAKDPYQDQYYDDDEYEDDDDGYSSRSGKYSNSRYYDDDDNVQVHYTERDRDTKDSRKQRTARNTARGGSARATTGSNVYDFQPGQSSERQSETIISHPKAVGDAVELADHVRNGRLCIVDLTGLDQIEAQRIADYLGGVCKALDGATTRVNQGIFTVSPPNHRVMPDYRAEEPYEDRIFSRLAR